MSNALKFTPKDGSVFVTMTRVERGNNDYRNNAIPNAVHPEMMEEVLRVEVRDTGAGIALVSITSLLISSPPPVMGLILDTQENQAKIFKEIVQFDPGKLQAGGGSGLGLFSKSIVTLYVSLSLFPHLF